MYTCYLGYNLGTFIEGPREQGPVNRGTKYKICAYVAYLYATNLLMSYSLDQNKPVPVPEGGHTGLILFLEFNCFLKHFFIGFVSTLSV